MSKDRTIEGLMLGRNRRERKSPSESDESPVPLLTSSPRAESRAPSPAVRFSETQPDDASDALDPASISVLVEGNVVTINPDEIRSRAGDPGVIVWWADLLSRAEREHAKLDATYRHNRARGVQAVLEADPNAAEWKARATVEASDWYERTRHTLAETSRACTLLRAVLDALQ